MTMPMLRTRASPTPLCRATAFAPATQRRSRSWKRRGSPLKATLKDLTSVVESQQFDRAMLEELFEVTKEMEKITEEKSDCKILSGRVMGTLFYEPSTRTRLSFETAMCRLGGKVVSTENAREFSSVAKGETLEGESLRYCFTSEIPRVPGTLTKLLFLEIFAAAQTP